MNIEQKVASLENYFLEYNEIIYLNKELSELVFSDYLNSLIFV